MTGPTDRRPSTTAEPVSGRSTAAAVLGAIGAAVGVAAALIPGLFFVGWLLGGAAIAAGLPAFRQGRAASDYGIARFAVFAGALAVVLGVVNLGIVLDWFDYFTADDAMAGVGTMAPPVS